MVLFLRNKRFNFMLFWADYYLRWWRLPIEERACRKTDLGGGDYVIRGTLDSLPRLTWEREMQTDVILKSLPHGYPPLSLSGGARVKGGEGRAPPSYAHDQRIKLEWIILKNKIRLMWEFSCEKWQVFRVLGLFWR